MRAARLLRAARLSVFTVCRNPLLNKVDDDDDDDDDDHDDDDDDHDDDYLLLEIQPHSHCM